MILREFYCRSCDAWFDAFTEFVGGTGANNRIAKRTHSCGALCETKIKPGSRVGIITSGVKSNEGSERRKVFQRYWKLTDDQMKHITRADIDRKMKKHKLEFVDTSWDDNVNGGRRERGEAIEIPPETEDPNAVRDYNAKRYGADFVQQTEEQIRAEYNRACHPDYHPLPRAEGLDAHETPHIIDIDKTVQELSAAPAVTPDRRQELQGRLVTGR